MSGKIAAGRSIAQGESRTASCGWSEPTALPSGARNLLIPMDEARLVVPKPGGFRTVAVSRFPYRMGRHHENELVLAEADVSRHHAEIAKEGERYFLADSNSRFGTFLNGTRIEREPLVHGDHIQLGSAS